MIGRRRGPCLSWWLQPLLLALLMLTLGSTQHMPFAAAFTRPMSTPRSAASHQHSVELIHKTCKKNSKSLVLFLENGNSDPETNMISSSINPNNNNNNQKDKETLPLYNAVPLFTGSLVMLFSLFLCGYGIYAGLTGDDPLAGHPKTDL